MADSGSSLPKAIASLAKKPSDTTRQGAQKLKFVPVLPARRKKEEVKTEPAQATTSNNPQASISQGDRGVAGRGRGRGRGRGGAAPHVPVEMTASGPFALGPAAMTRGLTRPTGRQTAQPFGGAPGSSLTGSSAPFGSSSSSANRVPVKQEENAKVKVMDGDEDMYSDPEDGVEIIDLDYVRNLDFMAPESLKRERQSKRVKKQEGDDTVASNALDLSESEEEEDTQDLTNSFSFNLDEDLDSSPDQDRIYFFQFPDPFPTFISPDDSSAIYPLPPPPPPSKPQPTPAPQAEEQKPEPSPIPKVDGAIGRLEIYRSGAVKMRLANGILLDVSAATQSSFLQYATAVDVTNKKLSILGEVSKRFVVTPDVDALLSSVEQSENAQKPLFEGIDELIQMDTS